MASSSARARAERPAGPWVVAAGAPREGSSAAQLHALGDEHYANRRFAAAREAWLGAYALVSSELNPSFIDDPAVAHHQRHA